MISRLSTFAAIFAIVATGTVTYAAAHQPSAFASAAAAAKPVRIVQLERVVIVAKRSDANAR